MKDDVTIAKCPGCKSDAIVAGVGLITEFGPMTYSQVQCGQSTTGCGYKGPYGHDPDHAIRLHNALCRPAEDGLAREAVAPAKEYEAGHDAAEQSALRFLKAHLATLTHTEAVADCLHCSLNYLISRFIDKHRALHALLDRSPPLEPFERLVAEDREMASQMNADCEKVAREHVLMCADRLERVLKSARGTKT